MLICNLGYVLFVYRR